MNNNTAASSQTNTRAESNADLEPQDSCVLRKPVQDQLLATESAASAKYQQYCRPAVGEMLQVLGMDVSFHRAQGDSLFYYAEDDSREDDSRTEVEITDFLGGYGASIFGHNHPRLLNKAIAQLSSKAPFNGQMSVRNQAANLAQALNKKLHTLSGEEWVTTLANSGAEAVEAALKHARFSFHSRLNSAIDHCTNQLHKIIEQLARNEIQLDHIDISDDVLELAPNAINTHTTSAQQLNERLQDLQQWLQQQRQHQPTLVALKGSFHGKTSGSLSLTANSDYREPFYVDGEHNVFVRPNDTEQLQQVFQQQQIQLLNVEVLAKGRLRISTQSLCDIAALFVEPLQGEGGIKPVDADYLRLCRQLTQQQHCALVFDEIQSGMGRTGTWLYSSQLGITADYYTLSKSLGGGLAKVSALMVKQDHYLHDFGLLHTSTFAEDDFSSAIALEALQILDDDDVPQRAADTGVYLKQQLLALSQRHPNILPSISGTGLMLGLQFADHTRSANTTLRQLSREKLLGYVISGYLFHVHQLRVAPSLSQSTTIRLEPSAYISHVACDKLVTAVGEVCAIIEKMQSHLLMQYMVDHGHFNGSEHYKDYRPFNRPLLPPTTHKKVGFVGHFIHADDLALWDPAFAEFTAEQRQQFLNRIHSIIGPDITDERDIVSNTGESVRLIFSGICASPHYFSEALRDGRLNQVRDQVQQAVDLLVEEGCETVGLGAYTSIVTHNCKTLNSRGAILTSGNSLTVAMGLAALKRSAEHTHINWQNANLSVVGATGNIASTYSQLAADEVANINLISHSKPALKRLQRLANRLYATTLTQLVECANAKDSIATKGIACKLLGSRALQRAKADPQTIEQQDWYTLIKEELGDQAPVNVTVDIHSVANSDVILSASNAPEAIIFAKHLSDKPVIICDISVPADVAPCVNQQRKNVTVIQGATVSVDCCPDFQLKGFDMPTGQTFACLSETLVMALSNIDSHFSYGAITKQQVETIMPLAQKHGFTLGRQVTHKA